MWSCESLEIDLPIEIGRDGVLCLSLGTIRRIGNRRGCLIDSIFHDLGGVRIYLLCKSLDLFIDVIKIHVHTDIAIHLEIRSLYRRFYLRDNQRVEWIDLPGSLGELLYSRLYPFLTDQSDVILDDTQDLRDQTRVTQHRHDRR